MSDIVTMILEANKAQRERLAVDKEARIFKQREDALFAQVQQELDRLGLVEYNAEGVTASISEVTKPYIADFALLEAYIREHGALDLLHRRLTESAVKARWEDGIQVPGIGVSTERKLRIK